MPSTKPKALVTGINGFVGSHLADLLIAKGYEVSGFTFSRDVSNLKHIESQVSMFYGDIRDAETIESVISQVEPDFLYHLAGSAFVPDADANPKFVFEVNAMGTLNLLEAIRRLQIKIRVLVVCTGEVYGQVPEENLPVSETQPMMPASFYGMTKACADLIAQQYAITFQMDVIRARPYNHIGPRQSEQFVCSSFAKQIVEIEKGCREPVLHVGNLQARRDFTDVRDIVRGYCTILVGARSGAVYNIGSGRAWKIEELVKILVSKSVVKTIKLKQDPSRMRANDLPVMLAETSSLKRDLNWKLEISIEQSLQDLLEYWRDKISSINHHESSLSV